MKKRAGKPDDGDQPLDAMEAINCTCGNLRQATRAVTQFYDEALHPSGVCATQLAVLAVLGGMSPVAMNPLAETLVMDRTTLSRNLKPLEKQGWVDVQPGADRRVRVVTLTGEGREQLARTMPLWRKIQAQMVKKLGRKQWAALLSDLRATVDVVQLR